MEFILTGDGNLDHSGKELYSKDGIILVRFGFCGEKIPNSKLIHVILSLNNSDLINKHFPFNERCHKCNDKTSVVLFRERFPEILSFCYSCILNKTTFIGLIDIVNCCEITQSKNDISRALKNAVSIVSSAEYIDKSIHDMIQGDYLYEKKSNFYYVEDSKKELKQFNNNSLKNTIKRKLTDWIKKCSQDYVDFELNLIYENDTLKLDVDIFFNFKFQLIEQYFEFTKLNIN